MARRSVPPDPSIGQRIKTRRENRGWSIRRAAGVAEMAHTTWSRVEAGTLRTDRFLITEIAAALECSVSDLTGQPHAPADRKLEAAHGRVQPMWRALLEIAPDEHPDREPPTVADLVARMDLLDSRRTRSDYAAVGQILPDLLLDLHAAGRGPDARAALTMLVDATQTARGTLRGLGYVAEAALAAERCRQTAEVVGDPVALAVADWARANTAAGSGSYRRAYTLATRAADELTPHLDAGGALGVLGMLHLAAAHASPRTSPDQAWGHLDEAAALANRTGETREWWMWFGPTNVGIWRMGHAVDTGEPGRAVELAADVRPTELPSADRQATYHVERARALADLGGGQDAAAERALMTAERLAPQRVRSYTAAQVTARFLRDRAHRTSALQGLCERMGVA